MDATVTILAGVLLRKTPQHKINMDVDFVLPSWMAVLPMFDGVCAANSPA